MAITPDPGIKNVIIKKDLLKKVTGDNNRIIRFRIVAEDKNRKSAYSSNFAVQSGAVTTGIGFTKPDPVSNTIQIGWSTGQAASQTLYDIFIGFDSSSPIYKTTTGETTYLFAKTGTTSVRVIVQASSIKPELNTDLEIYDSGTVSLV
jgi:hypothetical protein